jgi:hypothetical protein
MSSFIGEYFEGCLPARREGELLGKIRLVARMRFDQIFEACGACLSRAPADVMAQRLHLLRELQKDNLAEMSKSQTAFNQVTSCAQKNRSGFSDGDIEAAGVYTVMSVSTTLCRAAVELCAGLEDLMKIEEAREDVERDQRVALHQGNMGAVAELQKIINDCESRIDDLTPVVERHKTEYLYTLGEAQKALQRG